MPESTERGPTIIGDLPDLVSPVTGEVMHGRAGMRAHMRQHNLCHTADFTNEWKEKAEARDRFARGEDPKHRKEVRAALVESMKKLEGV